MRGPGLSSSLARKRLGIACASPILLALACSQPQAPERQPPPEIEEGLAGPDAPAMSTKLERTILGIDVLRVSARFGPSTSRSLEQLIAAGAEEDVSSEQLVDSIAAVALGSTNAMIQVELLRDVELSRFLEATRESLLIASDGNALPAAQREKVSSRLDAWFSFLEERGLVEGDRLIYRIRGDTVRTLYDGAGGYRLLDQTDPNAPEVRAAVLAGYLAEGVELQEGLAGSIVDE
jgi:hypothetical protein